MAKAIMMGLQTEPRIMDSSQSNRCTQGHLIPYPMIQLSLAQLLSNSSSNSLGSKVDHDSIISKSRRIASFLFF